MACRCSEIGRCQQDIRTLEGEIARELNNTQRGNDLVVSAFPVITQSLADAVFIENLGRISQRFATIKKQQDSYITNLQSRRTSELSRVRSRLNSFQNEDRRYHEMMERRANR